MASAVTELADEMESWRERALELEPGRPEAHALRAQVFWHRRSPEAVAELDAFDRDRDGEGQGRAADVRRRSPATEGTPL